MASQDFLSQLIALTTAERDRAAAASTPAPALTLDVVPAPALGRNPLDDDDDLPDPHTDALAAVLAALRALAIAEAATCHVRGGLCGTQWRALENTLIAAVGPSAPLPSSTELRDKVGTGPTIEWIRAQWMAARAVGDTSMSNWFASLAEKHGVVLQ